MLEVPRPRVSLQPRRRRALQLSSRHEVRLLMAPVTVTIPWEHLRACLSLPAVSVPPRDPSLLPGSGTGPVLAEPEPSSCLRPVQAALAPTERSWSFSRPWGSACRPPATPPAPPPAFQPAEPPRSDAAAGLKHMAQVVAQSVGVFWGKYSSFTDAFVRQVCF